MRALVFDNGLSLQENYPDPQPVAGESVVRVDLAGICGTDLELTRGYMNFRGVPGHEFVGHVVHSDDASLIGRRVAGEINAGCGHCEACKTTAARHCPIRTVLGILGRDGAFAEYLRLPNKNLFAVPDTISNEAAVMIEPLAAAYEIFARTTFARDASIIVLGDGRLGAIVALAFKAKGYQTLIAGHHAKKLDRLAALGIGTADPNDFQRQYDVVVDCTGKSNGFTQALTLVRPCGTIILKSTAAAGATLNLAPIVINEITVTGSRCGRFQPAIAALAAGANGTIDLQPLVDGVYPLSNAPKAFEAAADPLNFKILIRP
ncbi:MAG TPA: alcohol dehydrogenase catalytic domain-containing protein [Candidatus Binataceae bacterium]|nr:alcohol dehydrogenase catalytic domain-containing protein [Candidatus Binataceae bacterium]